MKHAPVKDFETATPVAKLPDRTECLAIMANALRANGDKLFPLFEEVENKTPEVIRAWMIAGSPFEPGVEALRASGVPVGDTIGDLMDVASLDVNDIHMIACYCHSHGEQVDGNNLARRMAAR